MDEVVSFTGHLSVAGMDQFYSSIDLFAHAGREAFGLAAFEAFYCGLPLVVPTTGHLGQILSGEPGVWSCVPTATAMARALREARHTVQTCNGWQSHRDGWGGKSGEELYADGLARAIDEVVERG